MLQQDFLFPLIATCVEKRVSNQNIFHRPAQLSTYDHRTLKIRLPVRSAIYKQCTGGLVVRWVTTSESPLLYVLVFFVQPIDGDFFAHVQHVQVVLLNSTMLTTSVKPPTMPLKLWPVYDATKYSGR